METQKYNNPKYYRVSSTSQVDETLFGNGESTNRNTLSGSRKIVKGPLPPSAAVITAHELLRIKNEAVIKSEAELIAEREMAETIKAEKEKKAKERKEKMRELEKRAALLAKKSDIEVAEESKRQTIRDLAAEKIDQNSDVVKLMNSMAQRAAAFTIRDQQKEDKKRVEESQKEIDERMNVMVEIDRLKDIQQREEEEKYKKIKRVEDRKVINDQIAFREKQKLLQLEAREQENVGMRKLMERYADEDQRVMERKKVEIEKSRVEVVRANEDAIRRKREARDLERKEMEDMLIYQAQKDAELARREEEELMKEKLKKERQAKLLAEQERVANDAGKLDELRARRAAEAKERQEREKEKMEVLKRRQEMKELLESRAKQAYDKVEAQKIIKLQEEEQIINQFNYTKKMAAREELENAEKQRKLNDFRTMLHKQIENIELARANSKNLHDPNDIRTELIREEEKLKVIRDKMVRDLEAQGVNPKYLSEMRNVDVGKMLKR